MKKYERYKDSGVEWLGEIPEHWKVMPLKYNLFLKGRIGWNGLKSDEFKKEGYAYLVTGQDFRGAEIDWEKCYQIDKNRYDEDPYIQLQNGDLLVTKDGTIGKVSKVSNLDKPACLNSGIFVVRQKREVFIQDFLYWTFVSEQLMEFTNYTSFGSTIQHLYQNVFENMPLLIPSISEQQIISTFLSFKVNEIDSIISEKQSLIDVLQSYRMSIITEAVTRGLNPDVPMKDSGVEWLGEIPKHWKVMKTSTAFDIIGSGTTPNTNDESNYDDCGINWLQTGDLNDGYIKETSKKISYKAYEKNSLKLYPKNSLVIAMYGATIGKLGILDIETTTNQACCVLFSSSIMLIKFAFYIFMASKRVLITLASGGGQPNISQGIIKNFRIPVPPTNEQQNIVSYLDSKVEKISASISELISQIKDLQDYRSALITEAVTGKIDLREWK